MERKSLSEAVKEFEINEGKSIELPNVLFELVSFGKDTNGNSVVKLKNGQGKGFSIQTNGNLPKTHSIKMGKKAKDLSDDELSVVAKEVKDYIDEHGSKNMKESMDEGWKNTKNPNLSVYGVKTFGEFWQIAKKELADLIKDEKLHSFRVVNSDKKTPVKLIGPEGIYGIGMKNGEMMAMSSGLIEPLSELEK